MRQALRESHRDEKQFHAEAMAKLQRECKRIQDRLEAMYLDKLDGRIDADFFDRKAAEFRAEQQRILRDMEFHQNADQSYIEEGIQLMELAHGAHELFENQAPTEKRKLLDFVLSNCTWKAGELKAEYRQPFDLIASAAQADRQLTSRGNAENGDFDNWRRKRDSNPR